MSKRQVALTRHQPCSFVYFGLIVTGEGEQKHLSKLFKSLMATGICHFEVIRCIGQRTPITSQKRRLEMVGSGKTIPNRDANEIGFPARSYLKHSECHFVVLIDDLEYERRDQAQQVFDRYRKALDTILGIQKYRASVHFLVTMLEAYYFADAKTINAVLGSSSHSYDFLSDYGGDVEAIRHPKNELKKLYSGFDEVKHGGEILERIDIEHVLSRPDTCASLRTLYAWCVKILERYSDYDCSPLAEKHKLHNGQLSEITRPQLDNL